MSNPLPTGMKVCSESTAYKTSNSPRGECFEWFTFNGIEWKPTHILFGSNWLLPANSEVVTEVSIASLCKMSKECVIEILVTE